MPSLTASKGRSASFLDLPIELRWMIYTYALLGARVAVGWSGTWDFEHRELEKTPFALMRTCKRVYADIVDAWPQWCLVDLGPLQRYSSVKTLDVLYRMPSPAMRNLQTLCISAFEVSVYQPAPELDQLYNGFSFFHMFADLRLKRLLLRWDDTISSPSAPSNHDYQYNVLREQLVQYGTGWEELYFATPFGSIMFNMNYLIQRRDGESSGAFAAVHMTSRDDPGMSSFDRCLYDALTSASSQCVAHVVVVKRGQDVNVQEPPRTQPVSTDSHTKIQWFAGLESSCPSYETVRQSFVI